MVTFQYWPKLNLKHWPKLKHEIERATGVTYLQNIEPGTLPT